MLAIYPAIIHDDEDGLWAEFPDLPGCFTQGDTQEELLGNAAEAMECFLLGLLEDGERLPVPTSPKSIHLDGQDVYLSLIQANIDLAKNTKSVKKTLTIPAWLNQRAVASNINFSSLLQNALMKELNVIPR
jgi:antitoxin HicB